MKILTCYMPPTSGDVHINDRSVLEESLEIRRNLGYLPEDSPLYNFMPVLEYLHFVAEMRGLQPPDKSRRIRDMIEVCGLGEVLGKDIRELSRGYRQRVGLAQALVHDPDLIILDEPTSGLDPNQIAEIRSLIREFGREKTLILSTHILPEVTATCGRVIIINRGRIVADGRPEELAGRLRGSQRVKIGFAAEGFDTASALTAIEAVPGVAEVKPSGREGEVEIFRLETRKNSDPRIDLYKLAAEKEWPLAELHLEVSTLEDIFRELTLGDESAPGAGGNE
jgi:ABC-2 type transport system ATP-binding protein